MSQSDSIALNNHRLNDELLEIKNTMLEMWKTMLLLRHSYADLDERVRRLERGGDDGTEELRGPGPEGDLGDRPRGDEPEIPRL
jgi:hypothetical protein